MFKIVFKAVVIIVLFAMPYKILSNHYSKTKGFTNLIYFGSHFKNSVLKEIKIINPETKTKWGYDGQFYVQVALRPSLEDKKLATALDHPAYRARRIGLPFLAFCLGLGKAELILQIYALLNFIFWGLLLIAIYFFTEFKRLRDVFLAISLLWTAGSLISVTRAITDLPAIFFCTLAVFYSSRYKTSSFFLSIASMIKETSVFGFTIPIVKFFKGKEYKRISISLCIVFLPITFWIFYTRFFFPIKFFGAGNLSVPFFPLMEKLYSSFSHLLIHYNSSDHNVLIDAIFEFICPLSLICQAIYIVVKRNLTSGEWLLGIPYVIIFLVMSKFLLTDQYGYCHVLLPLTFSFNLLLHKFETGKSYICLYFLGNIGMSYMILEFIKTAGQKHSSK